VFYELEESSSWLHKSIEGTLEYSNKDTIICEHVCVFVCVCSQLVVKHESLRDQIFMKA